MHDPLDERQFQIAVRRLAGSLSYGTDPSPFNGSGIEYAQSRPYVAGDPVKSIDWKVTARSGRVHVKEYAATKRMPVWLLLDTSASMCLGSQSMTKYAWAVQVATALALASLARVSPVGLLGCGTRDLDVRPSLSRARVFLWSHRLRGFRLDEQTTLARRLRQLGPRLDQRSLLVVLSDLHDPGALEALAPMAEEHDCVVIEFRDPAERGQLGAGIFRAREAETGRRFTAHGATRWLDPEPAAAWLRRAGIDHLVLEIEKPVAPRLRAFWSRRATLGKGSR